MSEDILIAPSILSADFSKLGAEISAIDQAGADYIHIDVMDNHFVPNLTFGAPVVKAIRGVSAKIFDCHLMCEPVENLIDPFAGAGADIITIHAELAEDVGGILQKIKDKGVKAGLSVKPGTAIDAVKEHMDLLDLILIMTVEPGFGGQSFMDMRDKIRTSRAWIAETGRAIDLEVDGGINPETAKICIEAGANVLVAGTSVFKGGPDGYADNIQALRG